MEYNKTHNRQKYTSKHYRRERVHQDMSNIIRMFELEHNYMVDNDPWKGI